MSADRAQLVHDRPDIVGVELTRDEIGEVSRGMTDPFEHVFGPHVIYSTTPV
ncbi:MAG: hypothetical protein WKF58_08185 [Ilumatobacteraceae bacterium]